MIKKLLVALFLFSVGCSSPHETELKRGIQKLEEKDYPEALIYFEHTIKLLPESKSALRAAKEGARIAEYETKEYKRAIWFLQSIVLHAQSPEDRLAAQKSIASIYLNSLQDYQNSVSEYAKLLNLKISLEDEANFRLNLARAYYYLNNYEQSISEIEQLLKGKVKEDIMFSAVLLKGNIYLNQKNYSKAIENFKKVISSFPDKSVAENVHLTLAVCYEEQSDYKLAIKTLEDARPLYKKNDFFEIRIKRLQERLKNMPGAKGFRK